MTCFFFLLSDYSKGFGGKFGVQNDRMDKVRSVCVCVVFVVRGARCHMTVSLVHRAQGRLRTWRSQSRLTRRPNPWRPVSVQQPQQCSSLFPVCELIASSCFFTHQLEAAQEASRLASRTSPSRRRRRTRRGRRRSERADRPRRSRSKRRLAVKSKRRPGRRLPSPPRVRVRVQLLRRSQFLPRHPR